LAKQDLGHSIILYLGKLRKVVTVTPLDNYGDKMDDKVTPIGQAPSKRAQSGAKSRHPAGRKITAALRCSECDHTTKAHTPNAGGCAYCDCELLP
jgi:hypothetical protein